MPIGKITAEVAKKGAVELIKQLIGVAITEAFKAEANGFTRIMVENEVSRDMRHRQLTKKGEKLVKEFEKHADAAVTGLSFSLAVAHVFGEANRFSLVPADGLLDTLHGMLGKIDFAVDREYQQYLERVDKAGVVAKTGNVVHNVFGVAETWHWNISWNPIYFKLKRDLRRQLQALEDARLQRIKTQKGREALKTQISAKLTTSIQELKVMIGKFVEIERKSTTWERESTRHLDSWHATRDILHRGTLEYDRLKKKGIVAWENEVYQKKDAAALREILRGYSRTMRRESRDYHDANAKFEALEKQEDSMEKKLFAKLAQIRDLHWQLWKVRKELNQTKRQEPLRSLDGLPPLDVPWRMPSGYVKLRVDAYPFRLNAN
ncbi:hypothetical protein [Roseibium sp.]|uniref:hypothetical protein n=1 Tax=Roseibium sp. TaxID=1936156 RepID=UPI0039F0DF26